MSLFGNLFHSIASVFDNHDDQQKKKQNNNQQQQQVVRPQQQQTVFNAPKANNTPENIQQPGANLNLTPLQKVNPNNKNLAGQPVIDANTLIKASNAQKQQQADQEKAAAATPVNKNSVGYKLTHNVLTNVAGGIVKPTAEFAHAAAEVPHAIVREVQNKPIDDIQQNVFGTTDSGKIAKKIIGDTINTGLLVAAPGIDNAIENGAKDLLPDATSAVLKKVVPKVVSGSTQAGVANATSTFAEGGNLKQIAKAGAEGELIGGAGGAFFGGIPVLRKAVANKVISPADAEAVTEVAPGVHTTNPNRPTDAAAQVKAADGQPQVATPEEAGGQPVARTASVADAEPVEPAPAPVAPIDPNSVPSAAQPLATEPPAAIEESAAPQPSVEAPAAPVTAPITPKSLTTAENAPGIRKAAAKKLGEAGKALDANSTTHDVFSNQELLDLGRQHAGTFNDADLVKQYQNGFNPHGAADLARGHAALERLNDIAATGKHPQAAAAIDHIIEGSEKEFSSGGRSINYAQQFYDGLRGPAKTSYLVRQIDKVREKAGLPLLKDNVDLKAAAEGNINHFIKNEETIKGKIATGEERLAEIKDEAQSGGGSKQLTKEATTLNSTIKSHQLELSKNTQELGKYYDSQAPQKIDLNTKGADLGRTLMLSSVAGRANDVLTTGINSTHRLLQDSTEAVLGKVANAVSRKSGANVSTLPSLKAVGRGIKFGAKKSVARFKGNVTGGESGELLRKADTTSGKGQLLNTNKGITGGLRKVVRSATEIATDLSEGVKESRIQQLASQQGKKLGLKGQDLKTYTAAQTAAPSRELNEIGTYARDQVNNMHDNKITAALDATSKGLEKFPVVGKQMRNLLLPFTRWTGGQAHNALVDKNAIVNLGQLIKAAGKKDTQGAITAASKLAINGGASITAGYMLAQAGLLTHENAQGYNDDGVYLHVNGRYIPATFLGFFAPGMIMGSSAHDAIQKNGADKDKFFKNVFDTTGNVLKNSFIAYGGNSLTGTTNPIIQSISEGDKNGYGDVLGVTGGQVVSQYIPAFTGDVNAVLNNGVPGVKGSDALNPTHEASLTKVAKNQLTAKGKPSTAKDVTKSEINTLLNKVPVVSQKLLPRNKGVAAADEVDRTFRGDRDTGSELQAKAQAKQEADTAADLKARGIPDPNAIYKTGDSFNDAVENRIENKKYDQAIEGLQANLKKAQSSPDATSKKTDPIEKQIATVKVLKAGHYDPGIRDSYSKTSLTEWRNMGNPDNDAYDPTEYQLLYNYDKDLAAADASSNTNDAKTPKYSLKAAKSGSGSGSGGKADKSITSNTLGSTPDFSMPSLDNLTPKKITAAAAQIPTIQQIKAGDLIKKRAISVGKA